MTEVATVDPEAPRQRRSGDQVRALIAGAARATFAERGYAGATTREIAQRAGLTEVLIFRHFGNKDRLFDTVILAPFNRLFVGVVDASRRDVSDRLNKNLDFVQAFYPFLKDNADLVQAIVKSHPEVGRLEGPDSLARYFDAAATRLQTQYQVEGVEADVPPEIAVRYCFGMLAAAVLFEDWFFPDGAPDRQTATLALTRMLFKALSPAPADRDDLRR